MIKRHLEAIALLGSLLSLSACAGSPAARPSSPLGGAASPSGAPAAGKEGGPRGPASLQPQAPSSAYAKDCVSRLSRFALSNGIPVVAFKRDGGVACVKLFLAGAAQTSPDAAGLDGLCLGLMARGPASMDAAAYRSALFRAQASVTVEADGPDYLSCTLLCPTASFGGALAAFASSLAAPALREEEWDSVLGDRREGLALRDSAPEGSLAAKLAARAFSGHPYALTSGLSPESLAAPAFAAAKVRCASLLGSNRLLIVAVGDFDIDSLKSALESGFGALEGGKDALPPLPRWESGGKGPEEFPAASGGAFARALFAAPSPADPDAPAFRVALASLAGALSLGGPARVALAYSGGRSPFAALSARGVPDLSAFNDLVDGAVAALSSGQGPSLAARDGGQAAAVGPSASAPLAESLELWKSWASSEAEEASLGPDSMARALGEAFLYQGDPAEACLVVDRIQAVGAEDVARAAKKWLLKAKVSWGVMGSQAALDSLGAADWKSFQEK